MIGGREYRFCFVLSRRLGVWSSLTVRSAPSLPVSRLRDKGGSKKNREATESSPFNSDPS